MLEDGYNKTPLLLGKVPFGKLLKVRDEHGLSMELMEREFPVSSLWSANIREL